MTARRVLVADDDAHMIRVVRLFLERAGYSVETVGNGQEALESILRSPPDALLTDLNMPKMTGRQLCSELESRVPERRFPIYLMTSMTDREHREWTAAMDDVAFLEKPVSMRMMVAELARRFSEPLLDTRAAANA